MFIAEDSLDDLLRSIINHLLNGGEKVLPTKGLNYEISGVLLELRNPRSRLSRTESKGKIFSCLGEFLWYLSGKNEASFIDYYIPDYGARYSDDGGSTIHGGYGPRLFSMYGHNQIENVIALLKRKKSSRRAVVQLFSAGDLSADFRDVPCTCTLQFLIRNEKLSLITHMRSNDAFLGLPHDIFSFTMLQEVVARSLGVELGTYKHLVGSMHLYDEHLDKAKQFISEGFHEDTPMRCMPEGDPWRELREFQKLANRIRKGEADTVIESVSEYWQVMLKLLIMFHLTKEEYLDIERAKNVHQATNWGDFKIFSEKRLADKMMLNQGASDA